MTETILAPKVRELIEKLSAAIERHTGFVAELRSAEAERRSHEEKIGLLNKQLSERNMQLAKSGGLPPDGPLDEEVLITKLSSNRRFYDARVKFRTDSVLVSRTEIQALKDGLLASFQEFSKELYMSKLLALEELARQFRAAYLDVAAIRIRCNLTNVLFEPKVFIGTLPTKRAERDFPCLEMTAVSGSDLKGEASDRIQQIQAEVNQLLECQVE